MIAEWENTLITVPISIPAKAPVKAPVKPAKVVKKVNGVSTKKYSHMMLMRLDYGFRY